MALKKSVKKKEHEKLTDANIERVIELLEAKPAITKKEACEILNISYNTTRLNKIIEEYKENLAEEARRRAANRGKPLTDYERSSIIEWTLDGDSIVEISKRLYRSASSIKRTIEEIGIPERSESYFNISMLPEACVSYEFDIGELVWATKTNRIAVICGPAPSKSAIENIYWVKEFERIEEESPYFPQYREGDYVGRNACYGASELGSLRHLKSYGIDLFKRYSSAFPREVKKALGMEVK